VVQLTAEGHSSKQIPSVLKINLKTVERCRAAVMRKLELSSPAAPVRYALRNRLVEASRQSWPIPHNPTPFSSDLRKTQISKERSPSSDGELVAEDEHPDLSTGSIDGDRAASSRRQFCVQPTIDPGRQAISRTR
jgi:Bacterial regulatory proteins, luxR family